jgi:phage gp36-like protein
VAYCVKADVLIAVGGEKRLIEFTDHAHIDEVNDDVLNAAIAEADAWIDSFCQKRHVVPFNPVPEVIKRMAAAETKYVLMRNLGQITTEEATAHDQRHVWLEAVSRGHATPGGDPPPPKSSSVKATVVDRDSTEDVSRESTKGAFW